GEQAGVGACARVIPRGRPPPVGKMPLDAIVVTGKEFTMSARAFVGLLVALVVSSGQSPVQLRALAEAAPPASASTVKVELIDIEEEVPVPGGMLLLVPATLCPNSIDWTVGPATTTPLSRAMATGGGRL